MSLSTGKCPTCGNIVHFNTDDPDFFCNACGTQINENNIILIDESNLSEYNENIEKLLTQADEAFNDDMFKNCYYLYNKISELDTNNIKAYFRKEISRLYLLKSTENSYISCTAFFNTIPELMEKIEMCFDSESEQKNMKVLICHDLYHFLTVRYSEEKLYIKTRHSKNFIKQFLCNISYLIRYCQITCSIINADKIGNDRQAALIAIKTVRLGIEMSQYALSAFEYIGEPEAIASHDNNSTVKYVRRSYTLHLDPEESKAISEVLDSFLDIKREIYSKSSNRVLQEIKRNDEEFEKVKRDEEEVKRAKQKEKNDWINKNKNLLKKAQKKYSFNKYTTRTLLCIALLAGAFFAYNYFLCDILYLYIAGFTLVCLLVSVITKVLSKKCLSQSNFYQNVLDAEFSKVDYLD